MFSNYFRSAWRSLLKDRQSAILNLAGLSTGLACTLLIYLWVQDELQFDRFHANSDRLLQLMEKRTYSGSVGTSDESSGLLAESVAKDIPEVQYAAAVAPSGWFPKSTLSYGEQNIKAVGQYAGKDYFNIFSFKLLQGNKNQVLADKYGIAISEDLAKELFHTTANVVGKTVTLQHAQPFHVSGVFERLPVHSSEQFDFVLSFEYLKDVQNWVAAWGNTGPHNYVVVKPGTDMAAFNKKLSNIITRYNGDTSRSVFATRYADNYLYGKFEHGVSVGGRIEYVRLFALIALFILAIACINFMNLSTARASGRLKEVGIKKVVGATRRQLVLQFLGESLLLTFVALGIALLLVWLLLPGFNSLTGKHIALQFTRSLVLAAVVIALVTGLISGSYPAFYLSRFKPVMVLKGKLAASFGELLARRGLVVFQFTLSVIFIVAVLVVYRQINYIQSSNIGYNKDNVVVFSSEGRLLGNQETFINEIKTIPGVVSASGTLHNIVGHNFSTAGLEWEGKNPNETQFFEGVGVGYGFVETMGIQMAEGRSFSQAYRGDSMGIILNEAALKTIGWKNATGKTIELWGVNRPVVGVIKDFHFESLHEVVKPMFLFLQRTDSGANYKIMVRIQAGKETETLARLTQRYQAYNPGFVMDYHFLDDSFQKQYESEKRVQALSKYFAGLAVLISCLGLFGSASFTVRRRQKEIGIRKVVGASAPQIAFMLSTEFLKLVGIALLLAFPVAWYVMHQWLQSFAYKIDLTPGVFIIAAASVILITICTISLQSLKAAFANPVRQLKEE